MIRPFRLRDLLAVRTLQKNGVWLDLFHRLLLGRSALELACIAPVPWLGAGIASYVWRPSWRAQGFVQMLKRPRRPEADLLYLAPALAPTTRSRALWETLLNACAAAAAEQELRRVFASLPEADPAIDLLAGLGWAMYSNEEVFVCPCPPPVAVAAPALGLRASRADDEWRLRRLYSVYTPQPVQHAEGHHNGDNPTALPLAWWELANRSNFVLERQGEVQGGVQLIRSRRGCWLLLQGDAADRTMMETLVRHGLDAARGRRWPVYCVVRDYQSSLAAVLQAQGFQSLTHRSRLVKHLAARARVAEPIPAASFAAAGPGS